MYLGQQEGKTRPFVDICSPKYKVQFQSIIICTVSTLGGGWRGGVRMEEGGAEGNGEERKQKGEGVSEAHFLVIIVLPQFQILVQVLF